MSERECNLSTIMASSNNKEICYTHRFKYKKQQCSISIICASNALPPQKSDVSKCKSLPLAIPSSNSPSSSLSSFDCDSQSSLFEETCDIIRNMSKQELTKYYKPKSSFCTKHDPWRLLMIHWMCTIVDVFDLSNQIVSVAVYYLDKSVAKDFVKSPQDYKLVSITALQLAIKIYDYQIFPLQRLLFFSNTGVTVSDVSEMERRLLVALNWMTHPPTYNCFVRQFCTILATCGETPLSKKWVILIEGKAEELSRKVLMTEAFRSYRPSFIAYAAILLAMDRLMKGYNTEKAQEFTMEISRLANFAAESQGFVPVITALALHMDDNGRVLASPMNMPNKSLTNTNTTPKKPVEVATTSSYPDQTSEKDLRASALSPCNVSEEI